MKILLLCLSLLTASPVMATSLVANQREYITVQGSSSAFTMAVPSSSWFIISAGVTSGTGYDTFRKNGSAYQVTSGKTMYCFAETMITNITGTSGSNNAEIGSSTASVNNSTVPAGYAAINITGGWSSGIVNGVTNERVAKIVYITFASTTYATLHNTVSSTSQADLYCYEQ